MAKMKVLVLFGGTSNAYAQSLASAAAVLRALPEEKYEFVPIGINKKGRWFYFPGSCAEITDDTWSENPDCSPAVLSPDPAHRGILILEDGSYTLKRIDVIFSLLGGRHGEDGSIQGLCELAHIPYVGDGVLGSAVCRNKALAHTLLNAAGIRTPRWTAISQRNLNRLEREYDRIEEKLDYPLYIKPAGSNASAASGIANDRESLSALVKRAFTQDSTVLVEELVEGREFRVGVFGYDLPFASFAGELSGDTLTVPAKIDETVGSIMRDLAIQAFCTLECRGLALFDFYYTENGSILLGEVNTLPALTEASVYARLMADLGMRYPYLLEKLIEQAIEHADR